MTPTNTAATKAGDLLPCPAGHNEARVVSDGYFGVKCSDEGCDWRLPCVYLTAECAIAEWNRRAAPPAEPASAAEGANGWVLVPRQPTQAMLRAACAEQDEAARENYGGAATANDIYEAMLEAAPRGAVPTSDPAQSADTPSEAEIERIVRALERAGWRNHSPVDSVVSVREIFTSRPQPARGEVSEAEEEAAYAAFIATHEYRSPDPRTLGGQREREKIRAALEAAARVRSNCPISSEGSAGEKP
jgi:hypothetical protein